MGKNVRDPAGRLTLFRNFLAENQDFRLLGQERDELTKADEKIELKIKIILNPFDENMFELIVSDTGIGMPKDLDIKETETPGFTMVIACREDELQGRIELNRSGG